MMEQPYYVEFSFDRTGRYDEPEDYTTRIKGILRREDESEAGKITIELVDVGGGNQYFSLFDLLDAPSQETADCLTLFDGSELKRSVDTKLGYPSYVGKILVINTLMIPKPDDRGKGLGYLMIDEALKVFGDCDALVVLRPVPLQHCTPGSFGVVEGLPTNKKRESKRKLINFYQAYGFQRIRGCELMFLHTERRNPTIEEAMETLKTLNNKKAMVA